VATDTVTVIRDFEQAIEAEALTIYDTQYSRLPKKSKRAIRARVKEWFTQQIYNESEDE
jgi:hypothetical protein